MLGSAIGVATGGYTPMSDVAIFEVRTYDVFSGHPPLLGLYSTAASFADPVFHPGPLLFDLLAIPVRLGPYGTGLALGMGIVNAAVVVAIPWVVSRFLGRSAAAVAAAVTGVWIWSWGPELLVDTFPGHAAATPFLLLLISAWGWAAGHDRIAIVAVVAYSLAGQTHGSTFVVGTGALAAAGVIRFVVSRSQPIRRRPLTLAASMLMLLWLQPILQQLFGDGPGNFSELLRMSSESDATRLGASRAVTAMASVLVAPPWWTRPGVAGQLPNTTGDPQADVGVWPLAPSLVGLLALVAVLVAGTRWMIGRGDMNALPGALVAGATLVSGFVYMSRLPLYEVFGFMGHTGRWLFPFGVFVAIFALTAVQRHLPSPAAAAQMVTATACVGVIAIAVTPWSHSPAIGPMGALRGQQESARRIRESLDILDGQGTVYVEVNRGMFPIWTDSILAELTRRGTPYVVNEPYRYVQLGERRRFDGHADMRLRVVIDPEEQLDDNDLVIAIVPGVPRPPLISEERWQWDSDLWADDAIRVVIEPYVPVGG